MCKLINRIKSLFSRKPVRTSSELKSTDGSITYKVYEDDERRTTFSYDTKTGKLLCDETFYTSGDSAGMYEVLSYVYDEQGHLTDKYYHSWYHGKTVTNCSHTYRYNEDGCRVYWLYTNYITGNTMTEITDYMDDTHKVIHYQDDYKIEVTSYEKRYDPHLGWDEWYVVEQECIIK